MKSKKDNGPSLAKAIIMPFSGYPIMFGISIVLIPFTFGMSVIMPMLMTPIRTTLVTMPICLLIETMPYIAYRITESKKNKQGNYNLARFVGFGVASLYVAFILTNMQILSPAACDLMMNTNTTTAISGILATCR